MSRARLVDIVLGLALIGVVVNGWTMIAHAAIALWRTIHWAAP